MNLLDNVAFPLRQHTDKGEDEILDIVGRRLSEVGLSTAGDKFPNELSGGQMQRVAIARALVGDPEVLLTGFGMDALRDEVAALLASLWEDIDVAVPYAAGELLARVRERGTVDLEYGQREVRVRGRVAPALAGELTAAAVRWAESVREAQRADV